MPLQHYAYILLLSLLPLVVSGQTCCTGSAPITGAVRISSLLADQWQFNLSVDYNNIADLILENQPFGDDIVARSTTTFLLQGAHGFGKNYGISILLPLVQHSETINSQATTNTTRNFAMGDITIFGQWAYPLSTTATLLSGLAIKFPTGITQAKDQDNQFILPPTLQAGTGSVDFILLIQGQVSLPFRKSLLLQQLFSYRYNTTSARFASHDSYRFGNEFFAITSFADQLVTGKLLHTLSLSFNIRYAGKNIIEDFTDPNSGGWWFNLRPGWGVNLAPKINLSVLYELPVFRQLNGFQLTTSYKIISVLNLQL